MTLTPILVCIALTVYHEARGEPVSDQVAVAQVVLERAARPAWHNDPCEVVHHRTALGCTSFEWKCLSIPHFDARAWTRSLLIASAVLNGSGHADFSATHYHARRVRGKRFKPWWSSTLIPVGAYGGGHDYYAGGG